MFLYAATRRYTSELCVYVVTRYQPRVVPGSAFIVWTKVHCSSHLFSPGGRLRYEDQSLDDHLYTSIVLSYAPPGPAKLHTTI